MLAKIIYDSLFNTHPDLQALINYFNDLVKLFNELSLSLNWLTPSGLLIRQKYINFTTTTLSAKILGKTRKVNVNVPNEDSLNSLKQINSFVPNLVHSMDAGHLALLVNSIILQNNNMNILSVHDCFGTNANDIKILKYLVINTFIKIYGDNDFIDKLHNLSIETVTNIFSITSDNKFVIASNNRLLKIPDKPKLGSFQLTTDLMKSSYFIN